MLKLLKKEVRLSASFLTYLFIAFAFITFCPGYPILVGTFFAGLGLFQSFQASREANDIVYTALLPVAKKDIVKAKYAFCVFIEVCYFITASAVTLIRMTVLADADVYRKNALMNANLSYLGFVLLIFALFNSIFVCGYFKTAYKFAKPFVFFTVSAFVTVGIGETLFHIPGLEALNAFGFEHMATQLTVFFVCIILYTSVTGYSVCRSIKYFDLIDL